MKIFLSSKAKHGCAKTKRKRLVILFMVLAFYAAATTSPAQIYQNKLGVMTIDAGMTNSFCSPLVTDLDGDPGTKEVILADEEGNIYAFRADRTRLWKTSVRTVAGHEGVFTPCQNPPAVADIDGDGLLEVIVTLGNRNDIEQAGRLFIIELDAAGDNPSITRVLTPQIWGDIPSNTLFNSPTLYDLDSNGLLDILATSFNETVYARDYLLNNLWPLDYDLLRVEEGFIAGDTIWSAATAVDADGDGELEVFFGVDAMEKWEDPPLMRFGFHQIPFRVHQGGALIPLHGRTGLVDHAASGKFMITHYAAEGSIETGNYNPAGDDHLPVSNPSQVLQSTPVIADVDGDGELELIHGTGQLNFAAFDDDEHGRVYCWNLEDATLAWSTNIRFSTNQLDEVYATVALGYPNPDNSIDVYVRSMNDGGGEGNGSGRLFRLSGVNGGIVWQRDLTAGNGRALSAVVADVTGDGSCEILQVSFGNVFIFDEDGTEQEWFGNRSGVDGEGQPYPFIPGLIYTTPAVADLDGDGNVEVLLAAGDGVHVFQGTGVGKAPWPQYLRNERHQAVFLPRDCEVLVTSTTLPAALEWEGASEARIALRNTGSHRWTPGEYQLQLLTPVGPEPAVVELSSVVEYGEEIEFIFQLSAAAMGGERLFEWRMAFIGGGITEYFGEKVQAPITLAKDPRLRVPLRIWTLYDY